MPSSRVVLDTNVVVSAYLKKDGIERLILNLALSWHLKLLLSADVFAEYKDVLLRPKLKLPQRLVLDSLALIRSNAHVVRPTRPVRAASDHDDDKFLECAEAAKADFLITGNLRHFPKEWKGTRVLNARQMIAELV